MRARYYLHRLERCLFTGAVIAVVMVAVLAGNKTQAASLAASEHTTQARALLTMFGEITLVTGVLLFAVSGLARAVTAKIRERRQRRDGSWYGQ
jgi:uncharacterized integral membrane protein